MKRKKIKAFFYSLCCLLLVACSTELPAQDWNWAELDKGNIISKDSLVRDGYTLLFYNKAPQLKKEVKQRIINAFFAECAKQEKDKDATKNFRNGIIVVDPTYKAVAQRRGNLLRLGADHFQTSVATNEKDVRFLMAGFFILSYEDMVKDSRQEVAKHAANNWGWNVDFSRPIFSVDTMVKGGYTLLFYVQSAGFDSTIKRRMAETFFTVYPKQVQLYNSEAPKTVIFVVDTARTRVAAALGNVVHYNPEWMANNPEDIDIVTHEVMHVTQGYQYDAGESWLTEGIADYARYTMGVNNKAGGWLLPDYDPQHSYKNAYRITARFLLWLEKHYNKNLVKKLDDALRKKTYSTETWRELTGKSVDELWEDYAKRPDVKLTYH